MFELYDEDGRWLIVGLAAAQILRLIIYLKKMQNIFIKHIKMFVMQFDETFYPLFKKIAMIIL